MGEPMLNTSQWPRIELNVISEIRLDPNNVRLEHTNAKIDADIMQDLFTNEQALNLVQGISRNGYFTHEIPIVLSQEGKYIVVEGNRRVAALKAIQNPMLVPDFQARIKKATESISEETKKSLSNIEVLVAPSKDEAEQLVAAIHTSNLRKPWSPRRQAAFFQAQIDAGRTLKELVDRYPTIKVRQFVFRARMLNLFKNIKYADPELQDYVNSKKWMTTSSTLTRIYTSKDFLALTGISMDNQGHIVKEISDSALKKIATIIVEGIKSDRINTRTINSTKSTTFKLLINKLEEVVNDEKVKQTSNSSPEKASNINEDDLTSQDDDNLNNEQGHEESKNNSTSRTSSGQSRYQDNIKNRKRLDFSGINIPETYPEGIKKQLNEISQINVYQYPNLTYIAIRSTLEKTIKAFAAVKTGDPDSIKQSGTNVNGFVYLSNTLEWLLKYAKKEYTLLVPSIKKVISNNRFNYTSSRDALNAANHNYLYSVTPEDVFNAWSSINPIMRYVTRI